MIEKTLIRDAQHFANLKKRFWKNTTYAKYSIGKPDHYPCIALEISDKSGDLGTYITIEDFVYVSDFSESSKPLGKD
jgi:hypothetical protein